jgi:Invasin, domain 3
MTLQTIYENQDVSYIVYDKVTGLPIGRHRHLDAVANKLVEVDEEEILSLYAADEAAMQRVTDADAANLAVIQASLPEAQARFRMRVARDRLVEQPKLVMFSNRDELEGNGEDKATLTIQLQDDKGKVISKANDAVLVTTTRGKLSERGGEIVLERGRASLTLTSVPETVRVVMVRAELVNGGAEPAEIKLAFM